jgi:hypothetical protein
MTGRSVINFGRIVAKRVKNNLFGGKNVNTGNMISEDGGNKCATTRARPASTPSHDPILTPRPLSVLSPSVDVVSLGFPLVVRLASPTTLPPSLHPFP